MDKRKGEEEREIGEERDDEAGHGVIAREAVAEVEDNGVGGYENSMLDLIFNLSGALLMTGVFAFFSRRQDNLSK